MPVTLAPGRLRLATRPNVTGSPALTKTIGIVDVAAFAARPEWIPPTAAIGVGLVPSRDSCPAAKAIYSITSSARASSIGGISRPIAFAVLRLMSRSNFVGSTTGKSAGLSPFTMRPT